MRSQKLGEVLNGLGPHQVPFAQPHWKVTMVTPLGGPQWVEQGDPLDGTLGSSTGVTATPSDPRLRADPRRTTRTRPNTKELSCPSERSNPHS